jgi:hypothetical protein
MLAGDRWGVGMGGIVTKTADEEESSGFSGELDLRDAKAQNS